MRTLLQLPKILMLSGKRVLSEQWLVINSSLAFATMLSIVPFALIGVGLVSRFPSYDETMTQLNSYVLKTFVPGVGEQIEQHLSTFAVNASSLPVIGVLALFVSAGLLLLEIHSAFHKVWNISNQTPWARRILELWAMITLPPILAVSSDWLIDMMFRRAGWEPFWLISFAPFALVWIVLVSIYLAFSPRKNIPIIATFFGSFVATGIFFMAKRIFIIYLSGKTVQNIVYGALSVIPLVQIWLFIFWTIVMYGAMVTQATACVLSEKMVNDGNDAASV